MEYVTIETC